MKQIFLFMMLAIFSARAQTNSIKFQSAVEQTSLLELYSSEGCSSCPPAEKWLTSLKDRPGLWRDFVPVAFHVDYWDYLGWRDPWAKAEFSDRQQTYAAHWHSQSVYTPGFVLNGKEWTAWPGGKDSLKTSSTAAGRLTLASDDANRWQVDFVPVNKNKGEQYEVHAALLGCGLSSDVKAGENRGRRLVHDFAVLQLATKPLTSLGDSVQGEIKLSRPSDSSGTRLALAVWITKIGSLEPLQATGGWIVPPIASPAPRK
jgi:hypothetical protein